MTVLKLEPQVIRMRMASLVEETECLAHALSKRQRCDKVCPKLAIFCTSLGSDHIIRRG